MALPITGSPSDVLPPARLKAIRHPLLGWFRAEQRDLPWRRDPNPYAIWVSEMMLQQTQVATVIPYFERWMARFPTVADLAAADEADVLHAWQGLGYYSRARNLLRGAQEVMLHHGGRVPSDPEALRRLPGIGPYTAGAIASIAYNVAAPIVDGNVVRVLCRLFALRGDPARAPLNKRLWELAGALIPPGEARDFNPALMELGATVCTPLNPRCGICPVEAACEARALGIQDELPKSAPRPTVTAVSMAAAIVARGDQVLLVQRPPDAVRWAGMWEFPNAELRPGEDAAVAAARAVEESAGLKVDPGRRIAVIRHGVTRYRITLEAFLCSPSKTTPASVASHGRWVRPEELDGFALPAAHQKIGLKLREEANGERQLELALDR